MHGVDLIALQRFPPTSQFLSGEKFIIYTNNLTFDTIFSFINKLSTKMIFLFVCYFRIFDAFAPMQDILSDELALKSAIEDIVRSYSEENVKYLELRTTPKELPSK